MGIQAAAGANPAYGLSQIIRLVSLEGLVSTTYDGRPVARLAESWTKSADGLLWRFKLRQNVKFHDGSVLDAQTVKQSLDEVVRTKSIGGLPAMVDVLDVQVLSPSEIAIHLQQPSTFLLEDMNLPITHGGSGTGAFYPSSQSSGEAVLTANEDYYLGRPVIDRIVIKPYTSLRTAWADMMRGSVGFLYDVSQDALDFVRQSSDVRIFPVRRPYAYIVYLNLHVPALQSVLVRRALNEAIDREKLVQVALQGVGSPDLNPVWPENWAYDPSAPKFQYRPADAAALLDQAGLPPVKPVETATGRPWARLSITCLVPAGVTPLERLAVLVQQQLGEQGIDLKLSSLPLNEFIAKVTSGQFEAAMIDAISGPEMSPIYWYWHSPLLSSSGRPIGFNFGDFRDARVDQALDDVRHANSDAAYKNAVSRFQSAIVNDPPAIFLTWSETFRAVSRDFQVPEASTEDVISSIRLWKPAGSTEATQ